MIWSRLLCMHNFKFTMRFIRRVTCRKLTWKNKQNPCLFLTQSGHCYANNIHNTSCIISRCVHGPWLYIIWPVARANYFTVNHTISSRTLTWFQILIQKYSIILADNFGEFFKVIEGNIYDVIHEWKIGWKTLIVWPSDLFEDMLYIKSVAKVIDWWIWRNSPYKINHNTK